MHNLMILPQHSVRRLNLHLFSGAFRSRQQKRAARPCPKGSFHRREDAPRGPGRSRMSLPPGIPSDTAALVPRTSLFRPEPEEHAGEEGNGQGKFPVNRRSGEPLKQHAAGAEHQGACHCGNQPRRIENPRRVPEPRVKRREDGAPEAPNQISETQFRYSSYFCFC